jgi:hypothetical protein
MLQANKTTELTLNISTSAAAARSSPKSAPIDDVMSEMARKLHERRMNRSQTVDDRTTKDETKSNDVSVYH